MTATSTVPPGAQRQPRLRLLELLATAVQALRSRRLRAFLSALGIAIGIAAMVAVVGISSSAQANLLAEIDALGTNLLTVSPGTNALGDNEVLPATSAQMTGHMQNVLAAAADYQVDNVNVYRTPLVPSTQTGGIGIVAASDDLPEVVGAGMASGHFLDAVSDRYPEAVLGAEAASTLQITRVGGHVMVDIDRTWFVVIGVMRSATLDTSLDSDVFISLPVAERTFHTQPNPSKIYVRANQDSVVQISNLLAATADPQDASGVSVSRPSDALEARAAAKGQFTTLLVGLGAVALLVGAIGIANIMVLSVLERRGEVGLRRSLGATRRHIATQFLTESAILAILGGLAGLILGAGATWIYASTKHEPFIIPLYALIAAPAAGFAIGAVAGFYPAIKAARLSPTEALRAE